MREKLTRISGLETKMFFFRDIVIGVATGIGPRILHLSDSKNPELNLFGVLPEAGVKTKEGFWRLYGGHRLWASPEADPRSYSLDAQPVKISFEKGRLSITGNPEEKNSIHKEIEITYPSSLSSGGLLVNHKIRNVGRWPIRLACWALSVMRKDGFAVIPLQPPKDRTDLLPDRHITLWPYTDLTDKRLVLDDSYVAVKQSPQAKKPIKIGAFAKPAWTAYWTSGKVFVKSFSPEKGEYPDFGCSVEVYTNSDMLELETVGPLRTVEPGEVLEHRELWTVFEAGETDPAKLVKLIQSREKVTVW